jgi:hypothetical protein
MGWLVEAIGTGSCVSDETWGECQLGQMTMKRVTVTIAVSNLRSGRSRLSVIFFFFHNYHESHIWCSVHISKAFSYVKPIYYVSIPCTYRLPFTYLLTYSMEQSPSWEANSKLCTWSRNSPHLWNLKVPHPTDYLLLFLLMLHHGM